MSEGTWESENNKNQLLDFLMPKLPFVEYMFSGGLFFTAFLFLLNIMF